MFYFKFCQDNAFVVIVLSTFQIYIDIPRVNKQETHKQTNKQTVTKWLNTFTMGKCRKWIFLFTINIHRKQIIKFKKIILRFSEWHNAEGTIFSNYIKQEFLTHETKLAYALSLVQPYIYNIHLTCNSTNWQWHKWNKSGFTSLELRKHSRILLSKHIQLFYGNETFFRKIDLKTGRWPQASKLTVFMSHKLCAVMGFGLRNSE